MLRRAIRSVLAVCAVAAATPAFAHHSQVMFDSKQCLQMEGTVRNWEFGFPHSWLWIIATGTQGTQDIWGFEAASPAQMIEVNDHWTRDVFKKGDKITVRYSPLKDGRHGGQLNAVVLPGGQLLRAATPACDNGKLVPGQTAR